MLELDSLDSPIWIASGPWELPDGVDKSCVGAYTTKTVTPKPNVGNKGEVLKPVPGGLINRMGLPSLGLEKWIEDYESVGVPTFLSYSGTIDGLKPYLKEIGRLPDLVGIELNISCPSSPQPFTVIDPISEYIYGWTELRLIVKAPPNFDSIRTILQKCRHAPIYGVVVSNSHPAAVVENGQVFEGGMSGPNVKYVNMALVKAAKELKTDTPIIACGGVQTGQDVSDYLSLGANFVQVGSKHLGEPDATTRIMAEYLDINPEL